MGFKSLNLKLGSHITESCSLGSAVYFCYCGSGCLPELWGKMRGEAKEVLVGEEP